MKPENNTKKKEIKKTNLSDNNYDIDIQACSAMDCTGLIPAAPKTEEELEAYEEIYPYITHANVKQTETK